MTLPAPIHFGTPYLHERLTLLIFALRSIPMLALILATILMQWQVSLQEGTNTFFGATVDPGFYDTPEGLRIYSRWNIAQWVNTILCGGLCYLLFLRSPINHALLIAIPLLFFAGRTFIYSNANRAVRAFAIPPSLQRTAVLIEPRPLPAAWKWTYIGIHIIFAAMFVATALFMYTHRALLPEQIVYQAQGYAPPGADAATHALLRHALWHAFLVRYFDLILCVQTLVIMFWLCFGFLYRSRVVDWQAQMEGTDSYRRAVMIAALWAEGFMLVQRLSLALEKTEDLASAGSLLHTFATFSGIGMVITFALLWKQYRERPYDLQDHIPDAHWKWGQYYVDRNDPAWLVPSRMRLGMAFNYGNPATWVLLVLIAVTICSIRLIPHASTFDAQNKTAPNAEWALYHVALQNLSDGDRKDAADVLVAFADTHRQSMSEVAGALAGQKIRLSDAQRLAVTGLARVEKRTAKVDLNQIQPEDIGRMRRLAAAWDAMGQVYAAQDNDAAAEPYMLAAWGLTRDAHAGVHLADLHLRRNDADGAKTLLEECLSHVEAAEITSLVKRLHDMGDAHPFHTYSSYAEEIDIPVELHNLLRGQTYLVQRNDAPPVTTAFVTQPSSSVQVDLINFAMALQTIPLTPLPDKGPEIVLRSGMVNCQPKRQCEITLSSMRNLYRPRHKSTAWQSPPDDE